MSTGKSSSGNSMNALACELRTAIVTLGKPAYGEKQARWLPRAARAAGITVRTARALFHRERPDPRASVVELVRAAINEKHTEEARDEYADLCARIARLETAMAQADPDFFRADRDALRALTGGTDSPMDSRD